MTPDKYVSSRQLKGQGCVIPTNLASPSMLVTQKEVWTGLGWGGPLLSQQNSIARCHLSTLLSLLSLPCTQCRHLNLEGKLRTLNFFSFPNF